MKFTLQELLKQKSLLDNHLAWLNSKIAELKGETPEKSESTPGAASTAPSVETVNTVETTTPIASEEDTVVETIAQQYQATQSGESPMMKVGCIAVVIGICLFFLFVLFILPNWLYPD